MLAELVLTLIDGEGNVQASTQATVVDTTSGMNATLYSDEDASGTITNPPTSDAKGEIRVWVRPNDYTVTAGTETYYMTVESAQGALKPVSAAISSGAVTLNCLIGAHFYTTLSENITSVTISSAPETGSWYIYTWELTQSASYTIAGLPAAITPLEASFQQPTTGSGAKTLYQLATRDAGTTWIITKLGASVGLTGPGSSTDNALVRWDGTGATAIQNSAWALSDGDDLTAAGDLDMNGNALTADGGVDLAGSTLTQPKIARATETIQTVTSSSAVATINFNSGHNVKITLFEDITSFTFSNVPATGQLIELSIRFTQDGTGSWTVAGWPGSVKWAGGSAPTITATAGKTDVVVMYSDDGGTTWFADVLMVNC